MGTITQKRLKEVLNYDEFSGAFTWLASGRGRNKDLSAGCKGSGGYLYICVDYRTYLAHRLAWLYVHGHFPKLIDHIDGDKINNRILNLRKATPFQSIGNTPVRKDNTSGYKGVSWEKRHKRWRARIVIDSKDVYLGEFVCKHQAAKAYNEKASEVFGDFARLNVIAA